MKSFIGVGLIFIFWITLSLVVGTYFVPFPWQTIMDVIHLLISPGALTELGLTVLRVALGFSLAFLFGLVWGWLIGRHRTINQISRPTVLFFQGMPPILWTIPLILIMGIGFFTPVLVIALITFPLIVVNIAEGVHSIPRKLEKMLFLYAPGFYPSMREVYLPHLRPFLLAVFDLAIVLALKASVIAEFFGAKSGIGAQINGAYQSFKMRELFAWGFLVVLLILACHGLGVLIKKQSSRQRISDHQLKQSAIKADHRNQVVIKGIKVENLTFGYKRQELIFENLSLHLQKGEIGILAGDSGVGKTTLIHLLAGVLKSSRALMQIPNKIGMVFQDNRLLPWRTVFYNAALSVIYSNRIYNQNDFDKHIRFWLEKCGLADKADYYPDELSGGMKKRLALARCLCLEPEVLFLDEPFVGLDKKARVEIWQIVWEYHKNHDIPILIVTHHPEDIPFLGQCRIFELNGKQINKKSRSSKTGHKV